MYVTLHLAAGQTIKQLVSEVAALSGGVRPRSVSGRMGVLVDSELAYRYLAIRHAPPAPVVQPEPAPVPTRVEVEDPPQMTPAKVEVEQLPKAVPVKRPPTAKKAAAKPAAATPRGE